jgi:PAS domain S-box-containing protein
MNNKRGSHFDARNVLVTMKTKSKPNAPLAATDERGRKATAFRASEMRYRRLFETAHDGVLLVDPATRKIVDANPFMTKLLGYTQRQLVGKELFEIGLLKDEVASREMFKKLKRKHEVRYEDLPLKSRRGQYQEVEVVANLYQEDGHAIIQCNIRDITARKRLEQQLSEKARLLDLSHDAIIVRDMVGHIRYWNHGAEELYGWSRAEAMGKLSHVLLRTEFPIPLKKMLAELYRTDRWIGELVHTSRAGRRITVLARKTLDRDGAGQPAAVLETLTDITERQAAADALSASEERFRAAVGIVSSLIWTNNAEGLMTGEQPGWGNFTGQTQKEYQGYGWAKAVHPQDAPPTVAAWKKAVAAKRLFEFEHRVRRRDGEWRLCSVRALPLLGEGGQIREWVGVHTDITERKAAEAAQQRIAVLAATNEELVLEIAQRKAVESALKKSERHYSQLLEKSDAMQEQLRQLSRQILLAQEEERKRISRELHDVIAQTLTGINVRLTALKKEAARNTRHLDRDIASTQRLVEKSVNIVHEFARELRPAVLDDLGLIPALHSFAKLFSKRTGVHVQLQAFAGVEALDIAKRTIFYRVAQEALTNVSRHAHASRVEVNIEQLASGIGMKIHDNGQAFDVERVLNSKGSQRLGLLGMRERVEMVGGTFGVESAPGQGTTIRVEIPTAKIAAKGRGVHAASTSPIPRASKRAEARAPRNRRKPKLKFL